MFALVHSGAPSGLKVYADALGFTWEFLGFSEFIRYSDVHSGEPRGCRFHSGSRGLTRAGLGVAWYTRVRARFFTRALSVVAWFILFHVNSSFRSQGSVGLVWVHLGAPSRRWVHSRSRGFTMA